MTCHIFKKKRVESILKILRKQVIYLILVVCTLVSINYVPFGEDDFPRVVSASELAMSIHWK